MIASHNYRDFNEEELLNDPYFQDWVIQPNPEKDRFWKQFLLAHPEKREVVENAQTMLRAIGFHESWPAEDRVEAGLKDALDKINRRQPKLRIMYRQWVAVAAILLLLVGGSYYYWKPNAGKELAKTKQLLENDVAPGGNKAILTLGDGTKMVLDVAGNGTLTRQGNVTVTKLNGQLAYNSGEAASTEVLYNTINTPNGGQYQLVMSDGTKVWLNAASSIRYPTRFTGSERRVEVSGEAYFEVAKNKAMPFKVNVAGKGEVEVLGTHFNVNAYSDEPSMNTTLLEGSIRFTESENKKAFILAPGQQVKLSGRELNLNNHVDLESVLAWKNGAFNFASQDIVSIMRQISRWYDVEVVYKGTVSHETFTGIVSRNRNVSEVLSLMEDSGVKFKIEGRKIIVQF